MSTQPTPSRILCDNCGYELGFPPLRPCPECGKDCPRRPLERRPLGPVLLRTGMAAAMLTVAWLIPGSPRVGALDVIPTALLQLLGPAAAIAAVIDFHIWSVTDRQSKRIGADIMWVWIGVLAIGLVVAVLVIRA